MDEIVEAFLRETGVSEVSLISYRRDLEKLLMHFSHHPERASREELVSYFARQGESLSPSSLTRQVSVVRSFYTYLKMKSYVCANPMEGIRAADFVPKDRAVLDREEFSRLIDYSLPGFRGMRDRAMLMLLCETGLRVTELVELDLGDLRDGCLLCGEGRRRRTLSVTAETRRALSKYLALRELYAADSEERKPLFITARETRITRQGFWKNLKERAIFSGIDKPISPHTLRRSLALHLMEEGRAREEITLLLGNADPASFRGYQTRTKGENNGSF